MRSVVSTFALYFLTAVAVWAQERHAAWLHGLRSPDPAVRLATLVHLNAQPRQDSWSPEDGAVLAEALLSLVQDSDLRIRAAAVQALGQCRVPVTLAAPAWARALNDPDVTVRRAVGEAVAIPLSVSVPTALRSPVPQIRAQLLCQALRDARAITPVLRLTLGDLRPDVRSRGLDALHGGLLAVERLPTTLSSADYSLDEASLTLRRTVPAWLLDWALLAPEVIPLVAKGSTEQRLRAAEVLEQLNRLCRQIVTLAPTLGLDPQEARVLAAAQARLQQVLPSVSACLEGAPPEVRLAILAVLETQPDNVPACRPAVLAQLAHQQPAVRWAAARLLAQWGPGSDTSEWHRISSLLDDADADVRQAGARALHQWTQRYFQAQGPVVTAGGLAAEESLAHLRECLTTVVRAAVVGGTSEQLAALRIVQASGSEAVVVLPELRDWLVHSDPAVRRQIPRILSAIGPAAKELMPDLERALADDDAEVRTAAAQALLYLRGL